MKINIYTRDQLWAMTPRRLRVELQRLSDYGYDEIKTEDRTAFAHALGYANVIRNLSLIHI